MKLNRAAKFLTISLAAVLLLAAPSLYANGDTATIKLTGAGSNVYAGVYIGPYQALIDGVPTAVICDDFSSQTTINQTWTAHVTHYYNDLSKTKFNDQPLYDQAAWLTLQLLSAPTKTQAAHLQFAIWGLMDQSAITYLQNKKPGDVATVQAYINSAKNQAFAAGQFAQFSIYTPVAGTKGPPQEFLVIRTPEPETIALLLLHFAFLGIVVFYARRRRARGEA